MAEQVTFIEEDEGIDLQYYFSIIWRNVALISILGVIALALSAIYAFRLPNQYIASSEILLENQTTKSSYSEIETESSGKDSEYMSTQVAIITSENFSKKVMEENPDLVDPFLAQSRLIRQDQVDPTQTAAKILQEAVAARQIGRTRIIRISAETNSKILSVEAADAAAKAYVKQQLEQKFYVPQELLGMFPSDNKEVTVQTPFGQLEAMSREDVAKTLPSVVNDPVIRELRAKRNEVESLLKKLLVDYKDRHPKVLESQNELNYIDQQIEAETNTIITNLKTSLTSQLLIGTVRILKEPDGATRVGPQRGMIMAVGTGVALFFLMALLIIRDKLDDSIKNQEDVEKHIQLPFLGIIPNLKEKIEDPHQRAFYVHYNPLSDISESFRFVKVAVNFSGPPGSLKCLMVTSSIPEEGKSTFAGSLMVSFLQDGEKVLLVDSDMRHPSVHLACGAENKRGLTNYLSNEVPLKDVVQKSRIAGLDIVSSGSLSPNPAELFSSYRMKEFVEEAKQHYDRILIDTAPITGIADALVIGRHCDGTILLVQSRRINQKLVINARKRLLASGIKVLGVVLNRVDVQKEESNYQYYAYSSRYYARSNADAPAPAQPGPPPGMAPGGQQAAVNVPPVQMNPTPVEAPQAQKPLPLEPEKSQPLKEAPSSREGIENLSQKASKMEPEKESKPEIKTAPQGDIENLSNKSGADKKTEDDSRENIPEEVAQDAKPSQDDFLSSPYAPKPSSVKKDKSQQDKDSSDSKSTPTDHTDKEKT